MHPPVLARNLDIWIGFVLRGFAMLRVNGQIIIWVPSHLCELMVSLTDRVHSVDLVEKSFGSPTECKLKGTTLFRIKMKHKFNQCDLLQAMLFMVDTNLGKFGQLGLGFSGAHTLIWHGDVNQHMISLSQMLTRGLR